MSNKNDDTNKDNDTNKNNDLNKNSDSNISSKLNSIKDIVESNNSGISWINIVISVGIILLLSGTGLCVHKIILSFKSPSTPSTPTTPVKKQYKTQKQRDLSPESYLKNVLNNEISNSSEQINNKFGNFDKQYIKILQENPNNKIDLSSMLSLREQNYRRQVFLEVLLFNLVQKHKELLKEVEGYKSNESENADKLKQVLYVNQLLQNKMNKILDETKNVKNEKQVINKMGKTFKYMKVGPKMYQELKRLNIDKNLPKKVRDNISKGLVHVVKI
jgi:hypothetical protein